MAVVHSFHESLKKSHSYENAPWWEAVYRKAFPGLQVCTSVRQDGWAQRGGIDRILVLRSGKTITVDEKIREKDWPDILLERYSDKARKTPGWMHKELACDYIAYAFVPSETCYLLPFLTLRKAWIENGRDWIRKAEQRADGFALIEATNNGYVTQSVAVPIKTLFNALENAMAVSWRTEQCQTES